MVGRPPMFENKEDLEAKVEEYFEHIKGEWHWEAGSDEDGKPVDEKVWDRLPEPCTITGLCLFLGFESRQSFHDYGNKKEFSYTIKRARLRIENEYEKSLHYSKSPVAQIFALKNLGWSDKQEIEQTNKNGDLKIEIVRKNAN